MDSASTKFENRAELLVDRIAAWAHDDAADGRVPCKLVDDLKGWAPPRSDHPQPFSALCPDGGAGGASGA